MHVRNRESALVLQMGPGQDGAQIPVTGVVLAKQGEMKTTLRSHFAPDYRLNTGVLSGFMNLTVPESLLWSVKARAGIPRSAALSTSFVMPEAPSRKEYGLWTWRCTNMA